MRQLLAWMATALLASRALAADNHLSGAYDSEQVTFSEAPKKSADGKTWLRRESPTTAPYTEAATTAPTPAEGGGTGVKYEGDVTAVIIPWEARSAKSSGYSSSKAPMAKPERSDVVEGGDVYVATATAKPSTDKMNDSHPRDSVVPVQVNEDKGPGWQSTVDFKTDRGWYQRTSAPEPATKTNSPYTDVYGDKTSSPTSDFTSATNDESSVKSVRNAENDVDRRESADSRDKTEGHLSLDDQIESSYKTSGPRPVSGKPSDVYADKEAAPFDEGADSSASYAPAGRATYKWGKDTSESRGHSEKEQFKKYVAAEDYAQTVDKVKETRRHHSVSGSLGYNGKPDTPRVEKADSSSSYGEDSADSVDAESQGYRSTNSHTSKTKPGRPVQDGEYDVGGTGSRDEHQWRDRHQHGPAVPEGLSDDVGQLPPYLEKAGPSNSHAAEDPYDENARIPSSQEHSASSSLDKSSDVYAEKGAAPFADEETPYGLTGQEKREGGIAAATFPWGKKSSETEDSTEPHGYHTEGLKTDAAVNKDSEDNMQADQYNVKVKGTHRDDLVPESLDDDKWSVPYDWGAALGKDASTTLVYSEKDSRLGKTNVPDAKSPYDDSEDVKRGNYPSTATFGEHSNALHHSQYDAEGTSASKAATDSTADEVADADSHNDKDDPESPGYPNTESTPLRLKRDGEDGPAGNDAKVTEDIDSDPEDQQNSPEPTRTRNGGGWHKSIHGNIEVPDEPSTAPVESDKMSSSTADSRYDDKTSSQMAEQSSAASSETASPPYSQEMTPTYDDKTNPPPLPSSLSEGDPKPPREQASSESSSATSGTSRDKGIVGANVPWKTEGSKAVAYSSTDAPTSPPEYHEKTEDTSAVYRDTLGPVISWNGGKPQLVREQTNKAKLGSGGTESGVYSDERASETRGNSHSLDDLGQWSGGHALFLRSLESNEQPEENKPEEEPVETSVEESGEHSEDKNPEEEPTETPAEESAEQPKDKKPEEEPTGTPAEESVEHPEENRPEEKPVETPAEESAEQPEDRKPEEESTETPAEEPAEDEKPEEEPVEIPIDEPVEPSEEKKSEEELVETPADEPVEGAEVEESDGLMQTTTVSDENVRWDQDDCDPCDVPTLPPTLPPIYPHANDDYTEHLPNVSDVHEAWKELKENAPVPSDAPTKPPRKKPCKEDLKHCTKVIGEDGERYECENGYTLTPTEQPTTERPTETPTERPTEQPTTERPTETPTERPTETPSTETPTESPTTERPTESPTESPTETPLTETPTESPPTTERPTDTHSTDPPTETPSTESPTETPTESPTDIQNETPTPGTSEPTPAPSQPSDADEITPTPSTPSESEPTPSPTESYDEPEPTPAASTTEGDNAGGISTPYPTATAAATTVTAKPATTTESPPATKTGTTTTTDASAGDTAYATGKSNTATTGEDANANAVGASTSEGNTSGSSALGGGAIAGIVIACVVFAAVVVGAVLYKQRVVARQREENLFADLSATGGRTLETDYAAM